MEKIALNLNKINNDIKFSCGIAGRDPSSVKIVAATKYADIKQINTLLDLGITDLGENKADDLLLKSKTVNYEPVWHFLGHLQSNKIKKVVPIAQYIHSIDKIDTLSKINYFAESIGKIQKVLIEVNISEEETKFGISKGELNNFIMNAIKYGNIKICGLMTMAPITDDYDYIRYIFSSLRNTLGDLNNYFKNLNLSELSMGMSNDYKIAVEEGATIVRIGSAIFK
ncbi:MAG: YggS family pyridoxal phosphate-dependent enzyme [Candidatus Humimicrobiaceae bacterium]